MNFYHYRVVIPQIKLDITISTVPPILSFYILAEGCRQGMSLTDYNWLISLELIWAIAVVYTSLFYSLKQIQSD